jgi:hypothetical protein
MSQPRLEGINFCLVLSKERTRYRAKNYDGKIKEEVQAQGSKVNSETKRKNRTDICIVNQAQNKILKPTNQKNL